MDICPKCRTIQPEGKGSRRCLYCGLDFAEGRHANHDSSVKTETHEESGGIKSLLKEAFLDIPPEDNPWIFGGRVVTYILLLVWGIRFFLTPIESDYWMKTFMHAINLPFHEAGHIFFSLFGIGVMGGSLMQLIVPFTFVVAFIRYRNLFAASVALWWFAQNFLDLSPYINDARSLKLMLIGGVTGQEDPLFHDWYRILARRGWLQYDHTIASLSYGTGVLLMAVSFLWSGFILHRQYKSVRRSPL